MPKTHEGLVSSQESFVAIHNEGTSYVGGDAIALYRAATLLIHLKLFVKTGIVPMRGFTGPKLLEAVSEITKETYSGKNKYSTAIQDLLNWKNTMFAAMPVIVANPTTKL